MRLLFHQNSFKPLLVVLVARSKGQAEAWGLIIAGVYCCIRGIRGESVVPIFTFELDS